MQTQSVIVIGAGPVGIAAAAHLVERGLQVTVLEKGHIAGSAMLEWGHVRVFTPWKYLVDRAVERLLNKTSWQYPEREAMPSGRELVEQYLIPAANTDELIDNIVYDAQVIGVAKTGLSKSSSQQRQEAGFNVHIKNSAGVQRLFKADAVIDASGTWGKPNPIGLDGLAVIGERENQDKIHYGIPDVLEQEHGDYSNRRVLVLGGGHSAINVVLDLLKLQQEQPNTQIHWGLRSDNIDKLLGGGLNDELPARGELGRAAKRAIDSGALSLMAPFEVERIERTSDGLQIHATNQQQSTQFEVDRIIVAAGFRPDLSILGEIRLDIDEIVEAPSRLAPLIDPNLHSCGTVKPHGIDELSHVDKNFFIVGMKAYGRAPTFLMLTGYEQVRSIAAELAGDFDAARKVELVLPQTGVCSTDKPSANTCCAPAENDSCCASSTEQPKTPSTSCCG